MIAILQLALIIVCLFYGARKGGLALGLLGGIGIVVLVFLFGLPPGKPPVDVMLTIVADTCGRHDTLGGACAAESNTVRYGLDKFPMHSCRDNFLHALAHDPVCEHLGMSKRDLPSNINFFMNVPVTAEGGLEFVDGLSAPGKYVEMKAEMDVVVLISNCPQLNNPCNAYNPTPIRLLVWDDPTA